jgi:hypothetical protein
MGSLNLQDYGARSVLLAGATAVGVLAAAPAIAQEVSLAERLARVEAQLADQGRRLALQEARLSEQERLIETQSLELRSLRVERQEMLSVIRATGPAMVADAAGMPMMAAASTAAAGPPADDAGPRAVGEAPPPQVRQARTVAAVPEFASVLTPKGGFVLEPSIEYNRSSANRLVFRGVEIVPGLNLGVIEATDADRDAVVATLGVRYGVTPRLEVQASVPYVWRHDRVTTLATQNDSISREKELLGYGIGDIELAARYQFNTGARQGSPIFVGNLRVKPPTGEGPYDVAYDLFGVSDELAVGSGFWGVEAGMTAILPTDPAVIFGSLSYLYNVPKNVNKSFAQNTIYVGKVDPGDAINASIGFGLALNPQFSFSLGYSHSYYFSSNSWIGANANNTQRQPTQAISVGTLNLGLSYRINDKITLNNNFQFGMTSDAPDMRVVLRVPYSF